MQEAIEDGIFTFEFLNEVNLLSEWKWGVDAFVPWAKSVIAIIRQNHPQAFIISPGLSPTVNTTQWDAAFANGGLYAVVDGIGAHAYGTQPAHVDDPDQMRYYRRFIPRLTGTQKIFITECSLKFYTITAYEVGQLYGKYSTTLEPQVAGVWFFVLQGEPFASSGEEWVTRQDIARGLAAYVQTPVTREFDHWVDVDTGANLGATNPLTFALNGNRNIRAVTRPKVTAYTCQTSADSGTVTGGGVYAAGTSVTLRWLP
jgi:hypothetical protein